MTAKPTSRRKLLTIAIFILYALLVWGYWGDFLKQSVITNIFLLVLYFFKDHELRIEKVRADSEKIRADSEKIRADSEKIRADSEKVRADSEKHRADQIGEALKDRIGYQVGKLEIHADITDYNGNCDTRWVWTEIRKVHPDAPLSRIPGRITFSTPGCSFSEFPTLMPEYTGEYEIKFLRQADNFCEFQVQVKAATDEIGYGYTASISKAFCMSEEELMGQPYRYEWFGFTMSAAIENLTIRVAFPRHYKPDSLEPDVCIGWAPTDGSDAMEI